MKILIINGSPHKGNTWTLTMKVKDMIADLDSSVQFEEIHLMRANIPFCLGCSVCFRQGHELCPHNQAIQPIMDAIEASDAIIFSVSCFQGAVTGLTKNFTDHLAFLLHRPRYFDKKALIISTTGGVSAKDVTQSLANTMQGWGFNRCYQLPIVALSWNDYQPTEKHLQKTQRISKAFYEDVKSEKLHPPKLGVLIPFNLFQAMHEDYAPGTEYATQDGIFWKQYYGMRYAPGVPMPIHKRLFGQFVFEVGKFISPRMMVTYKKNNRHRQTEKEQ